MRTTRLTLAMMTALWFAVPAGAQDLPQAGQLTAAFAQTKTGEWDAAYALVPQGDALGRDLVTWTRLRSDGSGAFFDEYRAFTAAHPDWPGLDRLRSRGEEVIPAGLPPQVVIDWFGGVFPETGEGAVRLAEAYIALGQRDRAIEELTDGWVKDSLTDTGHAVMLAAYPEVLAPLHMARTETMLWRARIDDVRRMLPLLTEDQRLLVQARLGFITRQSDAEARFKAVPAALAGDPGLAYDRYNWLADRGDRTAAIAILRKYSTSAAALGQPFRWSGWRRSLARWEMREGRYDSAYDLAANHFLTPDDGESYADLEWISGFLALRFLNEPAKALEHFTRIDNSVEGPISLGRAAYWLGRTYDVLGKPAEAEAAYTRAARYQTAFYGLLAAEKLGMSLDASLTGAEVFPDWRNAEFLGRPMTRAALKLLTSGERTSAVLFFAELGKTLNRTELGQMGAILRELNEPFYAVLLGKAAARRDIIIPAIYYPMHDMAKQNLPVGPALALSIARRESEFRIDAGSSVGALGLMQLMPATAEEVAGELGIPYSKGRLTSDWSYNATLGGKYLRNLQDRFGPSPVMIAAGYNAGPSRPAEWMDDRGDPRLGEVDVIDWIEMIPFRETRNYVQRVTESIPIYEARISGQSAPIRFTALLKGVKPLNRPVARPGEMAGTATNDTARISASDAPSPVAVMRSIRPQARGN